ncbi:histidine kinase N-terminal 7TM domain-containing protein [Cohnella sp. GCM10012308]|uniref:histidine kinase N-terminal 7TM domain-containing diguanylate cyclase n=1 Tax=Cohnella sp. GCM10012308 TaxID=3317329 RepID=UPI00360BA371
MGTPYSAILTLIITAGVINLLMGIYALSGRSKVSMVKTFVAFSMLSAVYTFGSALELSAGSLEEIVLWIKVQYLGLPFLAPLNLLMVMYFLGMDKFLKRPLRIGFFIIPVITLALVMTNELHHLYYRDIVLRPDTLTPKADLVAGPWYLIAGAYTFGCMIGGVALLIVQWRRKRTYRFQLVTLLIGLLLPLIGDFFYLGGLTPGGIDPIPVIMTLTSAFYMWALASRGLFHVVPIARDNLFESMRDGVLVLDMEDRLVDYNAAAAAIMPELTATEIGNRLDRLLALHTNAGLLASDAGREGKARVSDGSDIREIPWTVEDRAYHYQVRTSVVRNPGGQIAGKLIVLLDITQRVQLQEQLRQMAYYDNLTGVYNRARFMSLCTAMLEEADEAGEPLSIVLFDIDHFKRINDTYGHDVGDQALLHIADICRRALRTDDLFARYGGEEFAIAMPGLTAARAESAAHRIRRELSAQALEVPGGQLRMTASFGIASTAGGADRAWAEVAAAEAEAAAAEEADGGSPADSPADLKLKRLLKQADLALYAAKNGGRDAVRVAAGVEAGT